MDERFLIGSSVMIEAPSSEPCSAHNGRCGTVKLVTNNIAQVDIETGGSIDIPVEYLKDCYP